MSQLNVAIDDESEIDTAGDDAVRQQMKTTHGHDRQSHDVADDDHPLAGMDSKRKAPIESVAKNVVRRYDVRKAAIREYIANAHTACILRARLELRRAGEADDVNCYNVRELFEAAKDRVGYEPVIEVKYNRDPTARWTLIIADNGIGIDSDTAYAIRDIGLSGWHMDGTANGQFGQGTMSGFLLGGIYGVFHMTTKSAISGENYRAEWQLTDLNRLNGERDGIGTTFTWPTFCEEASDIGVRDAVQEYSEGLIVPVIYEDYDTDGTQTAKSDEFLPTFMDDRYPDDALVITYEDEFGRAVWSPDDPQGYRSTIKTFCGYQPIDRNERGYSMNSYEMPSAFDFRLKVEDGSIIEVGTPSDDDDGGLEWTMDHELVGKTPVSREEYRSMLLSNRTVVPEGHVDDENAGYIDAETGDKYTTNEVVATQHGSIEHIDEQTAENSDTLGRGVVSGKFEGKPIVSMDEWNSMDDGRIGEEFVTHDEIPDSVETLVAMKPTDDRDRFERRHVQDVLRRYSEKLWDQLRAETARVFQSVDDFSDIFDLEGNEQALFHKGVSRFGPQYSRSEPETIKEQLADDLGVELPVDVCEKIGVMKKTVSLAPRDCRKPQKKGHRTKKPVWKVIRLAQDDQKDGDVYMGWRISKRKAKLAWELDENNQVIQTTKRSLLKDRLGWKDLSDLPTSDFEKHFENDFDEAFLDNWDKSRSSSDTAPSSPSGSMLDDSVKELSYNDKRAMRRDVTVRRGTGDPSKMTSINGETLFNTLDNSSDESASLDANTIEKLVCYRGTEHRVDAGTHLVSTDAGVFYAVVPNYVYEYLIEADEAYTEDEYMESLTDMWIDFDWSADHRAGRTIGDADHRDVFIIARDGDTDPFEEHGVMDEFRDQITAALRNEDRLDDNESVRSITYSRSLSEYFQVLHRNGCYELDPDEERPSVISLTARTGRYYPRDASMDRDLVFFDSVLPDLDRGAVEWKQFDVNVDDAEMIRALTRLQDAGGFASTDDNADDYTPDIPDDRHNTLKQNGKIRFKPKWAYMTKTIERLEDAGGFQDGSGGD